MIVNQFTNLDSIRDSTADEAWPCCFCLRLKKEVETLNKEGIQEKTDSTRLGQEVKKGKEGKSN
jgi:hypothetical protein